MPADGELRVFFSALPELSPLARDDDERVPVSFEVDGHGMARVEPDEPLEVGATYWLWGTSFRVMPAGSDTEPPSAPVIERIKRFSRSRNSSNGLAQGITVFSELDDDAAWLEIEVSARGDFSDAERFGTDDDAMQIGRYACETTWPEYRSRSYAVRARQVDSAGNASEWSEVVGACGCRTAQPGGGSLAWLVFGWLAWFRRRSSVR